MTASHNYADNTSSPYGFLTIISTLARGLGYFGMPHILLRFMTIEDKNKIKVSRRIASVWVVISMASAVLIGVIGNAMVVGGNITVLSGDAASASTDAETVIMKIALLMSENGIVPALVVGIIFAGILACTISTSDSQLLAASSSMSEDFLKGVFKINLSEKQSMMFARLVLLVISVLGIIIAWNPNSSVFGIVSFAWAGFGAAFGPLMLAALFWKRCNKYGAAAGIVSGGVMVFVWKFLIKPIGGVWGIYELLPAFVVSAIFIVVVSLATKKPDKELVDNFEAVNAEMKSK